MVSCTMYDDLETNIKGFADDIVLFPTVKFPSISANKLNHDLGIICGWAHQWKCSLILTPLSRQLKFYFHVSPKHPQLIFNGTVAAKVKEQKHLGLTLDSGLSFEKHLNEKIIKAKKYM